MSYELWVMNFALNHNMRFEPVETRHALSTLPTPSTSAQRI